MRHPHVLTKRVLFALVLALSAPLLLLNTFNNSSAAAKRHAQQNAVTTISAAKYTLPAASAVIAQPRSFEPRPPM